MFDIIAAGEILIDLVDTGNLQFSGTVGGAPATLWHRPPNSAAGPLLLVWSVTTPLAAFVPVSWISWGLTAPIWLLPAGQTPHWLCHAGRKRRPGLYILPPAGSGYPAHRKKHAL